MAKRTDITQDTTNTTRHYLRVAAFVVLGMSIGALLMTEAYPYLKNEPLVYTRDAADEEVAMTTSTSTALTRAEPVRLRIPALSLDVSFEAPLGLNADKTVEVPESYEKVGWYQYGASPGEIGPAVILGHVDSYEGAAVFYHLGQLKQGDRVFIERADGSTATFEVTYLERYLQSEFPTEKVYGKTEDAELRLITCTGTFIKGKQRYTHNLVVYAKLVTGE